MAKPQLWRGAWLLLETDDWGQRLAVVARTLVPPPHELRLRHPRLARYGRLGLMAAYMYRPVPICRQLFQVRRHVTGFRTAWNDRRARRAAPPSTGSAARP